MTSRVPQVRGPTDLSAPLPPLLLEKLRLGPDTSGPGPHGSESQAFRAALTGPTHQLFYGLVLRPGEGNGNPLQYFGLENSKDRGAWWATVHGVAESQTRLSI